MSDETRSLDALLPPAMAARAESIGCQKARLDAASTVVLGGLAGAFIAFGAIFATVTLAGTPASAWGPARVLAGVAFSLGLVLVVVGGAELFTGNNLIVMAWASGRIGTGALVRNWGLVYGGNAAGAVAIALLVVAAGTHRLGTGEFGATALRIAAAKTTLGFAQAVVLGVLCNVLVCLAVWLSYSARTTTDRILAVVFPISAFVAAGFEHSVANMYFVPVGLFIAALDPGFVTIHGLQASAEPLTWMRFVRDNLLPVTIGNVIGGAGAVGIVYWFVYLRPLRVARTGEESTP